MKLYCYKCKLEKDVDEYSRPMGAGLFNGETMSFYGNCSKCGGYLVKKVEGS